MFSQSILNQAILSNIEKDYDSPVYEMKYLSQGDNGCVYYLKFQNAKELCVKSILKGNGSAKKDYDICAAVYQQRLNFKFSFYSDDSYDYFTMPFFRGQSLEKLLNLDLDIRLRIIKKIIEEVKQIHSVGVIHRDLKAANIIVNPARLIEGNNEPDNVTLDVKIIDFGRSVRVFDARGKTNEDLALDNSDSMLYSMARKYQWQTAPEYSSVWDSLQKWTGMKFLSSTSEKFIGFRSDYYSIGTLFQNLIPEYASLANNLVNQNGIERNEAYQDFCKLIDSMLNMLRVERNPDRFYELAEYTGQGLKATHKEK